LEPEEGDARAHHNHVDVIAYRTVVATDRCGRTAMTLGVNMSVWDSDVQIVCHRIFEAAANIPALFQLMPVSAKLPLAVLSTGVSI
jgi:hypothetical protein